MKKPKCNYCGKDIVFKARRVSNRFKQYPDRNYYCDNNCYYQSMMKVIDIPKIYCSYCNKLLNKNRRVFGKSKFWRKKDHFCNPKCQVDYYSRQRKVSKEHKKQNWRRYNYIGWQVGRFRNKILERRYFCEECGSKIDLQIHHIKSVQLFPELFYVEDNIKVLCKKCHYYFHYKIS